MPNLAILVNRIQTLACIASFLVAVGFCGISVGQDRIEELEEQAIRRAVRRINPSLVRFETVGGQSRVEGKLASQAPGTGLVVAKNGFVISASFHFAHNPTTIFAVMPDGKKAIANIVGRDHSRKIVLLKIESAPDLPVAPISDKPDYSVGQTIVAVGKVFDPAQPNVSTGIISAKKRIWNRAFQVDAKISPANFGGPVLNLNGDVIGILAPMSPESDGEMAGIQWYDSGIGFAVPIANILQNLEDLMRGKQLRRGLLGAKFPGTDPYGPAEIAFCPGNSPAGRAGIRPGDQIVAINGQAIRNQSDVKHVLGPLYEGANINVTVEREKQTFSFDVELTGKLEPYIPVEIGITLSRNQSMPIVESALENGPARKAGLEVGDQIVAIDDVPVSNKNQLRQLLNTFAVDSSPVISFLRNDRSMSATVKLAQQKAGIPALQMARDMAPAKRGAETVEIKTTNFPNACFAIVPKQMPGEPAPALLVWIPIPGKQSKAELEKTWQSYSEQHNVVVLIPQSTSPDQWSPSEIEVVTSVIGQLNKQYPIDRERVVVGGTKAGGIMASLVAFNHRQLFRGLVTHETGISKQLVSIEASPVRSLLVLLSGNKTNADRIQESLDLLNRSHIPNHFQLLDANTNFPDWIPDLMRWVNHVDRL